MVTNNEKQLEQGTMLSREIDQAQGSSGALKKSYREPQLRVYGRMQHMTLSPTPPGSGIGDGGDLEP